MTARTLLRIGAAAAALAAWPRPLVPAAGLGPDVAAALHGAAAGPAGEADMAARLRRARAEGARFAALPELSLVGDGHAVAPETVPGPTTAALGRHARELGLWIAASVPEASEDGGHYLTTVLVDDRGAIASRYRAVVLGPDAGRGAARGNFRDTVDTVDAGGVRLGILSARDLKVGIPRLADRGAHIVLVNADWTGPEAAEEQRVCRDLSREYSVHIVVGTRRAAASESGDLAARGFFTSDERASAPAGPDGPGWAAEELARPSRRWEMRSALGLPASVPAPSYQVASPEVADLGRRLFIDPRLSSTGKVACSSCHQPERAFTNGERKGIGVHGRRTKRNVPSLLNVTFRPLLQWDGYASSLENFAKYPISGFHEMNFHYLDELVLHLRSRPEYVAAFASSMGVEKIEFEHAARALATYQRTLISGNSAFDRYHYGGDPRALGEPARRGLELFQGRAGCAGCHTIGERYATFTDLKYHDLGVGYRAGQAKYEDIGLGGISTSDQSGLFQTPSLRDVARTAPYMHDGSVASLREAVELHDRGGLLSPHRDPMLRPLGLTGREKDDLLAFLRALTGDRRYAADGRLLGESAWRATSGLSVADRGACNEKEDGTCVSR
jgi:cytochrome c peroxidase